MKFSVYGPFDLQRDRGRQIDRNLSLKYFKEMEEERFDSSDARRRSIFDDRGHSVFDACGCYVFRVASQGGGATPWYVGKAEKQTFRIECFRFHKIVKYNQAFPTIKSGKPQLILLAQLTEKKDIFRAPTTGERPYIQVLENILIGKALEKNPELLNIQNTRKAQKIVVNGFLNTRRARGGSAKVLRDTLS